jgi:hypothetical protein
MIKQFPEIVSFFNRPHVTEDDFIGFKKVVLEQYKDPATLQAALNLIELKWLQKTRFPDSKNRQRDDRENKPNTNRVKSGLVDKQFSKKSIKNKRFNKNIDKKSLLVRNAKSVNCDNFTFIYEFLNLSPKIILATIEKKGFTISSVNALEKKQLHVLLKWVKQSLIDGGQGVAVKFRKSKKHKNKGRSEPTGAWGKLRTYGMRGRLIYTR